MTFRDTPVYITGAVLSSKDKGDPPQVTIGYQSLLADDGPLGAIAFAVELGLGVVELNANMPWYFPESLDRDLRARVKDESLRTGVALAVHAPEEISFVSPHPSLLQAGADRMKQFIEMASDIGATVLTCHMGGGRLGWSTGDNKVLRPHQVYPDRMRESVLAGLPMLARMADQVGVKLSVENAGCFEKSFIQPIVAEVMSLSPLHLTWDVGHSNLRAGRLDEHERFIFARLDRLALIHVHDNDGFVDTHSPLGTGTVDLPRVVEISRRSGAPMSIEIRPRSLVPACLARLREIIS